MLKGIRVIKPMCKDSTAWTVAGFQNGNSNIRMSIQQIIGAR